MTVISTAPNTVIDPNTPPSPGSTSILIFEPDGAVNPAVQAALNDSTAIALPAGCDELAKIIPPDQAVANKAFQSSLQQVTGISTITAPQLAAALLG